MFCDGAISVARGYSGLGATVARQIRESTAGSQPPPVSCLQTRFVGVGALQAISLAD